jgi:hypothetical protein
MCVHYGVKVVAGEELREFINIAKKHNCTLLLDEFYSHYIYEHTGQPATTGVSSAMFIEDINRTPVLLTDGLTKCFRYLSYLEVSSLFKFVCSRYPGWRVGWILGPKDMISCIDRAASAVDGGPSTCIFQTRMIAVLFVEIQHLRSTHPTSCIESTGTRICRQRSDCPQKSLCQKASMYNLFCFAFAYKCLRSNMNRLS